MKREVELQSLVVKAVNDNGGRAFKASHRFMTGVVDLFVKLLPRFAEPWSRISNPPGGFIEVKQQLMTKSAPEHFVVNISPAQNRFLKEMYDAGCPTGVMSFVQRGGGSNWECHMAIQVWPGAGTAVPFRPASYVRISNMPEGERNNLILTSLYYWMEEWKKK